MKVDVKRRAVPAGSLLAAQMPTDEQEKRETHVDCFEVTTEFPVSLEQYIRAFYTTPLFRMERYLLGLGGRYRSTDADVDALARGDVDRFAAWRVAERRENEILLPDINNKTKSWLAVAASSEIDTGAAGSILRFGTAVVATPNRETGVLEMGRGFRLFMPAHLLYSRLLIKSAARRILEE